MVGGKEMSLVQGFIYKDFILVGGDGKAEFSNGIIDKYRKVFKLNEHTIIGFSGTISGNVCVFKKYINEDCSINHVNCSMSYKEIENDIVETFYANQDYLAQNERMSFICGWDGEKMTGKSLFSMGNNRLKGVHELTPEKDNIINVINCGLEEHFQYSFNQMCNSDWMKRDILVYFKS